MFADDAVALRPVWPALLSSLRFAHRTNWFFGNGAAELRCVEFRSRRLLNERGPLDPLRVRFDLSRWVSAFARSRGRMREISVVADDGYDVARLQLEEPDTAFDELIWRLMPLGSIAPAAPLRIVRPSRDRVLPQAGPDRARRLGDDALAVAARAALDARLPLRFALENSGGGLTWTPADVELDTATNELAVRAGRVHLVVSNAARTTWMVSLESADRWCPAIESCAPGDYGWLRLDVASDTPRVRAMWRDICSTLEKKA